MRNRDVYELALALLSEGGDATENGDYEERAGYLIAAFCSEVLSVNRALCASMGEGALRAVPIYLSLEELFPVKERFASAAGAYLAAMLILEEDPELSDKLFSRDCDAVSAICAEIPMQSERIVDRYGV